MSCNIFHRFFCTCAWQTKFLILIVVVKLECSVSQIDFDRQDKQAESVPLLVFTCKLCRRYSACRLDTSTVDLRHYPVLVRRGDRSCNSWSTCELETEKWATEWTKYAATCQLGVHLMLSKTPNGRPCSNYIVVIQIFRILLLPNCVSIYVVSISILLETHTSFSSSLLPLADRSLSFIIKAIICTTSSSHSARLHSLLDCTFFLRKNFLSPSSGARARERARETDSAELKDGK